MQSWPPVMSGLGESAPETQGRSPSLRLPLARLLQLLMILQAERYPNARRLAEACAVSRRTIYRDLATLEAAGIQVLYCPDRQGYQIARECLLQPLQLDDHEALALLIMSRSSRADLPFGLARHAQSALAKVVQALPPQLRTRITQCGELLTDEAAAVDIGQPEQRAIDEAFVSGLMHRKVLHLRSHDPNTGDAISTKLALYRVARIAGQWTLVGYSSFHGCVRIIDLQSVEKAEPTDEPYSIPPRFRLERLCVAEETQERSTPGHDVQLRFKPPAVSLIQGVPQGADRRLGWAPGGELDLFLRVELSDEFVCWILGFGDQIEVIRPQELRDAVRQRAQTIAQLHGPSAE
jgi:predicted DNA-binding transcriptional regulator YafY